jgi:hypothetical protein
MKFLRLAALATFALTSAACASQASAQHFDIFLARPATGSTTVIGGADVGGQTFDDVTRIFEVELAPSGPGEYLALEPGVNHPNINDPGVVAYPASAVALQSGDILRLAQRTFTVAGNTDDLFYWDGIGAPAFTPATASFHVDGAAPLSGTAGVGGAFDEHPFLIVDSAATAGIYLASLTGTVDGFAPSEPVYLVMGTEDLITPAFLGIGQAEFDMLSDDELDEALEAVIEAGVEYVEANVVPEPAAAVIFTSAVIGAALFRGARRRAAPGLAAA